MKPWDVLVERVDRLERDDGNVKNVYIPVSRRWDKRAERATQRATELTVVVTLDLSDVAVDGHEAEANPHPQYAWRFDVSVETTDKTLADGDCMVFDTSGSGLIATLPASPSDGDHCIVKRSGGGTLTIARNGKLIDNAASDYAASDGVAYEFRYDSATGSWWVF